MTNQQPKPLRLADALEQMPGYDWNKNYCEAVAELRRLHYENNSLKAAQNQLQQKPLTDEPSIWVLTSEYNDYDQHGEYFEAMFIGKPTLEQIKEHCETDEKIAAHILTGGGRQKYEDVWYNLRKENAIHGTKE